MIDEEYAFRVYHGRNVLIVIWESAADEYRESVHPNGGVSFTPLSAKSREGSRWHSSIGGLQFLPKTTGFLTRAIALLDRFGYGKLSDWSVNGGFTGSFIA